MTWQPISTAPKDGEPYPAFIRDNPIMQGAFSAFMNWIWEQDDAHDAHTRMTGQRRMPPITNPIDAMIDQATGASDAYVASFVRWAIDTQWCAAHASTGIATPAQAFAMSALQRAGCGLGNCSLLICLMPALHLECSRACSRDDRSNQRR